MVHPDDRSDKTMTKQFKNPKVTTLEDKPASDAAAQKRIELIAEKEAEKSSHAEQNYDHDHPIFSK
jgi:hypothetical protein